MTENLTYNVSNLLVEINNEQSLSYPWILVAPEFFNVIFLTVGVYTMYQGIEISHPLYAVLFLNLIVALAATITNMFIFMGLNSDQYVRISNAINGISLGFHCHCWCISSIIRYVYIIYDSWMESRVSNTKLECAAAIGVTFLSTFTLLIPIFTYAFYLGNYCTDFLKLYNYF